MFSVICFTPKREKNILYLLLSTFCKDSEKAVFFLNSSKCTQPSFPLLLLFLAVAFHYWSWNSSTWKHKVTNSLFLQQWTCWIPRLYFCKIYLVASSRKIRKLLDLFFFVLDILCPKSGWFCLCVCFYLGEIFLIFEVRIEQAEKKINSLIKLLNKRDL